MATPLSRLALLQPRSLDHALRMLRDEGPLVPLAGCTDLYVGLHFGTVPGQRFLDLQGLRTLRGIRGRGDTLVIGALTTYAELIASPLVRRRLPILAEASRWVGSPQIQNRGTLGGNVANASPAGDTLPVLAVAEATVVLRSADGERRVPFGVVLHRLPADGDAARRADRRHRDPPGRRPAVVPQGRHARRPGHLEGRDGGGARAPPAHRPGQRGPDRRPRTAHRGACSPPAARSPRRRPS